MNQITPDGKLTPRLRPRKKTPLKSNGRIDKSQVEGKVEGANPDDRSITGNLGLNEIGTPTRPDQSGVTAPPNSTSPLKKIVPKEGEEPSKPKKSLAIGYGPSRQMQLQLQLAKNLSNDKRTIIGPSTTMTYS